MHVSIVVIGDEILLGRVTDTNSGFISRTLGLMGWQTKSVRVVADNAAVIAAAINDSLNESELVITTGGLGPTKDDITKQVLTNIFGGTLIFDKDVEDNVQNVFERRGLKLNDLTRSQAMVPSSCRVIQNRFGTAPIMWFERDGRVLVAMPGVPFETEGMMRGEVAELLREHFEPDVEILHHTFIVVGITESDLATSLDSFEDTLPAELHLAYLPTPGLIRLRLDGVSQRGRGLSERFSAAVDELRPLLGEHLLHDGDATPAEIVLGHLRRLGLTLATAESCTGGSIAAAITAIPGSSESYMGSVVSYSNDVKHRLLGVNSADLSRFGAVSHPVVEQMAIGARRVVGTDCAVATSGIAGPGGGTPDKPVGTVWMAVSTPNGTVATVRRFPGNRERVIQRTVTEVLVMLAQELAKMA